MSFLKAQAALAFLLIVARATTAHGQYSTLGDLLHWYAHSAQAHPSLARYTELKEPGFEHTMLPLATFTDHSDEARIRTKPSVLLVFGEHAREIITCEVGLWFSRVLVGDTAEIFSWAEWPEAFKPLRISPENIASTVQGWIRRILDNLVVKVLPVENVDGRQAWEAGNLCLRKTSKGVDLNRNYPFAFAAEPHHSEMYGGPHPFSEAQSRLIARIALDGGRVPKAYINVHSGEWAVYSGWDSKAAVGPGLPEDLSDLLIRSGDVCRCQAGPAGAVSNYLAFGTGMDFMYTQLGVPYALTYEVYGHGYGGLVPDDPGRIPEGTHNKPLNEYPYVTDGGIARSVPRVEDILQPLQHHQQHQHHHALDAYNLNLHEHRNAARQHQNRRQDRNRMSRAFASKLRRSADERVTEVEDLPGSRGGASAAAEEGAGANVAGGGKRQMAKGSGGFSGWWMDAASRVRKMMLGGGMTDAGGGVAAVEVTTTASGGGNDGRTLLQASSSAESSSSSVLSSSKFTSSPLSLPGSLGGRSMRRLAAAMKSGDGSNHAVTVPAANDVSTLASGAAASGAALGAARMARDLQADLSSFSGPDGPVVAMVRSQPGFHQGCFDMFNPPPGPAYRDVISRWVVILLMTLDHVADPSNPKPSPHPLPGTVLGGSGVGPWDVAGKGAESTAFSRRRLLEASTNTELLDDRSVGLGTGIDSDLAAKPEAGTKLTDTNEDVLGASQGMAAGEVPVISTEKAGNTRVGAGRDSYGSVDFDQRAQAAVYEVDPVMRQHSLVVFVALCCLGVVFVPWFLFVSNQITRPLPPSSRRSRQSLTL
ncbi:hypothetical protein VaNZ11_011618 [Volvox africanus]|uniref:Peptidase M14 domain-containing protein n=1 Tax=Volvox africanus TaxID=51714 RepID=A0ABQ5SBV1_9CHLO|nr:hypothetical protein VaNZ11_011618 [Volvox africanus]